MINVDLARGVAKRNQLQDDPITLDQPQPRGAKNNQAKGYPSPIIILNILPLSGPTSDLLDRFYLNILMCL